MDALILVFALLLNLLIGLVVLLRNLKSATHILFFLFIIDTSFWSVANYFSLNPPEGTGILFWMRLVMALAAPQAVLFFLLIHTIPELKLRLTGNKLAVIVGVTLLTVIVALSPFLFTGVAGTDKKLSPVPGPGMLLFVVVAFGSLIAGLYTLLRKYRVSSGNDRLQLKLITIGIVSMFLLILLFNFISVVFFENTQFISLSPLYTFPFNGAVAYSIAKHRFLDVRLLLIRSVTYLTVIFLSATIYAAAIILLGLLVTGEVLTGDQVLIFSFLAMIVAISFPYIRVAIEEFTDRYLFKKGYRTDRLLSEIGKLLTSSLRLEFLTRGLIRKLKQSLKVTKIALIIISGRNVSESVADGYHPDAFAGDFITLLYSQYNPAVFDQLEEGNLKLLMRNEDVSLIIPLRTEGGLVGVLLIGPKESGDMFSEQDLDMLTIVAPEAAVTIQNALAYEEIRKFNVRLQEEVEKATSELKKANEQMHELDKLKDEFVSLASHELRTPMTAIRGSLSTILEGYAGEVPPSIREFLTAAYNENDRLIRLVNNLLNISRIEAGKLTFVIEPLSMDNVVMEVVGNLESAAKEKNLYLRYERRGDVPLAAGDADKVKEVLINLVGNAIKYTHKGGITLTTEYRDDKIVTSVTDTGSGIAKEDQSLLFKKFSQIQGSYAKQSGGTGLGLYICKQIIEGLHGEIWLDSTIGSGSTFHFSLPSYHRV
jgi:signal transduction histidine kinase